MIKAWVLQQCGFKSHYVGILTSHWPERICGHQQLEILNPDQTAAAGNSSPFRGRHVLLLPDQAGGSDSSKPPSLRSQPDLELPELKLLDASFPEYCVAVCPNARLYYYDGAPGQPLNRLIDDEHSVPSYYDKGAASPRPARQGRLAERASTPVCQRHGVVAG